MISAYNRLKSVSRSSLDHKTIGNYLYVYANMPTLCSYDPRPSVLQWITDKERRHRDTPKASAQQWFKTVFCNDDCNNENVADMLVVTRMPQSQQESDSSEFLVWVFCSVSNYYY